MKDRVHHERGESKWHLAREQPDERHTYVSQSLVYNLLHERAVKVMPTQVLHIFVTKQSKSATLRFAPSTHTGTIGLEDNNSVGRSGGNEGSTVGEFGPSRVEVKSKVR